MNPRASALWSKAELRVWPETYRLVSLPPALLAEAAKLVQASAMTFVALVRESEEVSLTIDESIWRYSRLKWQATRDDGPYRVITIDLAMELDVVGFIAPALARLAEAGIPVIPQCAHRTDHVVVREEDLARAVATLEEMIGKCREKERGDST